MQLRYNHRVYPTASQQKALARAFGCARVAGTAEVTLTSGNFTLH
ncbi:helix-turn-helix domain-containing protein [Micromonospora sp. NPDC005806]